MIAHMNDELRFAVLERTVKRAYQQGKHLSPRVTYYYPRWDVGMNTYDSHLGFTLAIHNWIQTSLMYSLRHPVSHVLSDAPGSVAIEDGGLDHLFSLEALWPGVAEALIKGSVKRERFHMCHSLTTHT